MDFFFRFFMDVIYYGVTIGFFKLLFLHTNSLGGWSEPQVILFVAGGLLLDGIFMTAIARNIWEFPAIVNKGELDFYLTRPFPSLLMLLLRTFEWSSSLNVVVGAGILGFAIFNYPEPLAIGNLLSYAFMLVNGFVLLTCIRLFSVLPVCWTHSQQGFHMLYQALEQVADRPDVIFHGLSRLFFLSVVPLFLVSSFPARAFFGELTWELALYALFVTCCFVLFTIFVWNRGLKVYSSASS